MKKTGYWKGFGSALLLVAMVTALGVTATAASRSIEVEDGIGISINGAKFTPRDADGKKVPVFLYNGTTYAPIRAVCEAAGMEVSYDSATDTVELVTADRVASQKPESSSYITQSRTLNEKLTAAQEKITALDVLARQAKQVTAPHDGYIVEINVKAGDSYDGRTAAIVISAEDGDAVLRADTSKIEKKIDKGTQVTVKRDNDKTLSKKVTDSGVDEEGKRYIDVKLTDKDIGNLGGGAALFSAAVDMTASYRATTSTTLLPASAVRGSGGNRYVYVVNEESNALGQRVLKVKKQDVKVLSEVGSTVSIQDDLSRQRVAYMEDRTISDGSEVMVYGE